MLSSTPQVSLSVGVDVAGRPVVHKTAPPGPGAERLRREAGILAAARHPGVVELIDMVDAGGAVTLRLRHAGGRSLATCGRLPVAQAAGVVSALAATVADLHLAGIAHGRIRPDHVLLTASGRPVLCGLAGATMPGRGTDAGSPTPADDVAALGALIGHLVGDAPEADPVPEHRGLWVRPTRRSGERRALLTLADHAAADDPARRPTAAQLAATLRQAVPDIGLPEGTDRAGSDTPDPLGSRRPAAPRPRSGRTGRTGRGAHRAAKTAAPWSAPSVALGAVVVGAIVLGAGVLGRGGPRPSLPPPDAAVVASPGPSGVVDVVGSSPATTGLPGPVAAPPAPLIVPGPAGTEARDEPQDTVAGLALHPHWSAGALGCASDPGGGAATLASGLACPAELTMVDGTVTVTDRSFAISEIGDGVVGVGDFTCTGEPRPAVLARDTGQIVAFDAWADDDAPVTGQIVGQIPDARRLVVEPVAGQACHRLVALDGWGIRHLVEMGGPAP